MQAIRRTLNIEKIGQDLPDRCSFEEALNITGFSKSALYKKTMNKTIPYKHYGKRLIFSREELIAWMEANTYSRRESDVEMERQII